MRPKRPFLTWPGTLRKCSIRCKIWTRLSSEAPNPDGVSRRTNPTILLQIQLFQTIISSEWSICLACRGRTIPCRQAFRERTDVAAEAQRRSGSRRREDGIALLPNQPKGAVVVRQNKPNGVTRLPIPRTSGITLPAYSAPNKANEFSANPGRITSHARITPSLYSAPRRSAASTGGCTGGAGAAYRACGRSAARRNEVNGRGSPAILTALVPLGPVENKPNRPGEPGLVREGTAKETTGGIDPGRPDE
jgi:hypothetical protein